MDFMDFMDRYGLYGHVWLLINLTIVHFRPYSPLSISVNFRLQLPLVVPCPFPLGLLIPVRIFLIESILLF
jgi:hypothetical protein